MRAHCQCFNNLTKTLPEKQNENSEESGVSKAAPEIVLNGSSRRIRLIK